MTSFRIAVMGAALLAGCGGGGGSDEAGDVPSTIVPPDAPGHVNAVPASPAVGESRAGLTYTIYIQVPATGDTFVFNVFEPALLEGGKKYPLVLYGHGGGEQRVADANDPATANQPINNPKQYIEHGYGVISMDQRGHGESSGTIRFMDPDYEGRNLLALLDWAEARLDWLDYGPSVDGRDPHNLKLGAIGASYGGAFQMLIHDIDPKHRLDAVIPEATYHDAGEALAPNGVLKTLWSAFLFLRLSTASNELGPSQVDPYAQAFTQDALLNGQFSPEAREFLYYHSNAYFCNGRPVATNGGPDTRPLFPPRYPGKINALFMQGMRDTLFNFNHAYANYLCYQSAGGDVRLRSYPFGHNATPVVPDPGVRPVPPNPNPEEFTPPLDAYDNRCASLGGHDAGLAFFDEYVKGIKGAADVIPHQICLSLASGDGVLVDEVTAGHAGVEVDIAPTTLIAGVPDVPVAVNLGITAGPDGDVLGGIPRLEVDVQPLMPGMPGEPVIFAGIGRASAPGAWELVDNQIMPMRGIGSHDIDLAGIGERLQPGDQLALLFYGGHNQYALTGSLNLAQPSPIPVTVTGKIWVPILGPLPAAP